MVPVESIDRVSALKASEVFERVRFSKYDRHAQTIANLMQEDKNEGGPGLVQVTLTEEDNHSIQLFRSGVRSRVLKQLNVSTNRLHTRIVPNKEQAGKFYIYFSLTRFGEIPPVEEEIS